MVDLYLEPLCGTLGNLNFGIFWSGTCMWNLGQPELFESGTFMWNLGKPEPLCETGELFRVEPECGTLGNLNF